MKPSPMSAAATIRKSGVAATHATVVWPRLSRAARAVITRPPIQAIADTVTLKFNIPESPIDMILALTSAGTLSLSTLLKASSMPAPAVRKVKSTTATQPPITYAALRLQVARQSVTVAGRTM